MPVQNPNPTVNEELRKEIENPDNYREFIKDKCVNCDQPLPNTWEYYKKSGNFCGICNSRASASGLRSYKKNKELFGL